MQRSARSDDPDVDTPKSRPGSRRNSTSQSRRNSIKKDKEKEEVQRSTRSEEADADATKSRSSSRRNSTSQSRRNSIKKEKEKVNGSSCTSTPKKVIKPANLDFVVTGRQCLKKSDRANSLPGYRRPSVESIKSKRFETPKRVVHEESQSSKSRETSLEDDMSLDLSQVSDFEDTNSKYGIKFLATSTPKSRPKPRSGSLQSHLQQQLENRRQESSRSRDTSRESVYKTSSSTSRYGLSTELDYSSVSPEYSGQSSADLSPRLARQGAATPRSNQMNVSSCCGGSWQDCSELETAVADRTGGEWSSFWANYNNSVSKVPVQSYYDQCPTPYRTENIDLADLEFSADGSRKRTPDNIDNINYVIRNEGLNLTPRETQNIIKCAHILGNVLTKAIERRCREREDTKIHEVKTETEDPEEKDEKRKNLTLDLKDKNVPDEKKSETVTTQTDISLPNTKSAPKIFEKILRQLSRTSLEEAIEKGGDKVEEKKDPPKEG